MFRVGDIVIGNKKSDSVYAITDSKTICEVINIYDGGMEVKTEDGGIYGVNPQYFEFYKTKRLELC